MILSNAIAVGLLLLALAVLFSAIRLLIGPTAQDRLVALDSIYISSMLILLLLSAASGIYAVAVRTDKARKLGSLAGLVVGLLGLVLSIYLMVAMHESVSSYGFSGSSGAGAGTILLLVFSAVLLAVSVLAILPAKPAGAAGPASQSGGPVPPAPGL